LSFSHKGMRVEERQREKIKKKENIYLKLA
jgi:hypothetical protein